MKRIIVVGNGMVGFKFCERFTSSAPPGQYQLTVFGEETRPAYDRVHLSEYFEGKSAADLSLASPTWYAERAIKLHCGELAVELDRNKKRIRTSKGTWHPYDKLVIATGSAPFVPPIEGTDKKGVFLYRTIEDLEQIETYAQKVSAKGNKVAAVLGGGLLGLEAAKAARDLGLQPHVIEFAPRLMPRQLDAAGARVLQDVLENMGLRIHLNKNTKRIEGKDKITQITFAEGDSLDAQMLIISAGIRPRDELAKQSGLTVGPRGGVTVNNQMLSSDPDIYVIGEAALYKDMVYGLVVPGYEMADVAAAQILGKDRRMSEEVDMSTKLKLIGVDVATFGDPLIECDDIRSIAFADKFQNTYKRVNVTKDGKKLVGGILVGDAANYNMLLQITQNGLPLPPNPEDLILGSRGESKSLGSVMGLPDNASICSCENVSKHTICDAVTSGKCEDVKNVCQHTKAGTGCGGCKPMVTDLVHETLKTLGKSVKDSICEHFAFNRRELYDIISVAGIKTFKEVIRSHGKGHGCEICKPVLASIFASLYNEIATVQETIQDTNDRFLANIQRNGTYSVVPRIPAGEITPEKLIVIGQVAKKYDLYTKITGGQRIDLFGARIDQLPMIWEELIDAGFESGHAYGKALRTVKSCVGSTWCRFGMDESVSFAIEIETRYKGIRSPHKLKGGVSGCIRECAEARGKDFGIIATEKGWNLYVCGNGGATPKHAVLLAENLDNKTCIALIDRFLMFYIKTAAPLTRTAAWLDKIEGGIEYLKQVLVQDSLGLAKTLEAEMEQMVQTYQCEWNEVVQNPALRQRFRHFVNADDPDENISFVPLREQKMPSPWA